MKISIVKKYPSTIKDVIIPYMTTKETKLPKILLENIKSYQVEEEGHTFILDHIRYHFICISNTDYQVIKNQAIQCAKKITAPHIHLDLNSLGLDKPKIKAVLHGTLLAQYNIHIYQSNQITKTKKLSISGLSSTQEVRKWINHLTDLTAAQTLVMDVINAPSNKLSPADFALKISHTLKPLGIKVKIYNEKQCRQKGLHALLAVNRGSENPARFVIMEYRASGKSKKPHIGLVGKGITFDTGGISIKGSSNMHYMKSDLGGATAVFGAMYMVGCQKPKVDVTAIIPTTDNSVDAKAIKPGDVIDSYSGKTIEVINTDAEGRLVLADGLAYIQQNYQTDYLMDLATLTGSIVRTLGDHAAGLFTKNKQLSAQLVRIGEKTGEQVWPMPMWDVMAKEMTSEIADIKNLSAKPVAGAITAAKFLEYFTKEHPAWVHLDIAGVAFGESPLSTEKCATGWGPMFIWEWIHHIENS